MSTSVSKKKQHTHAVSFTHVIQAPAICINWSSRLTIESHSTYIGSASWVVACACVWGTSAWTRDWLFARAIDLPLCATAQSMLFRHRCEGSPKENWIKIYFAMVLWWALCCVHWYMCAHIKSQASERTSKAATQMSGLHCAMYTPTILVLAGWNGNTAQHTHRHKCQSKAEGAIQALTIALACIYIRNGIRHMIPKRWRKKSGAFRIWFFVL